METPRKNVGVLERVIQWLKSSEHRRRGQRCQQTERLGMVQSLHIMEEGRHLDLALRNKESMKKETTELPGRVLTGL
jgi:hypothetical protein